ELDLAGAGVAIDVQHFLPSAAAVNGAKDAAFFVGTVRMSHRGHEHDVGIRGVDDDAAHLLDVGKADVLPRAAGVGGLEDPVADTEVGPVQSFAAADVHDVGVRRRVGYVAAPSLGR